MSVRSEKMIAEYLRQLDVGVKLEDQGMFVPFERIAVVQDRELGITAGGLVIPDNAMQGKPAIGTVVALGKGLDPDTPGMAQIGDRVATSKYGGVLVEIYLDGPDEDPTEVQFCNLTDVYVYWNPRKGTELDDEL